MTDTTPTTTINIRNVDLQTARAFKAGAAARGVTLGVYLGGLVALHDLVKIAHRDLMLEQAGLAEGDN